MNFVVNYIELVNDNVLRSSPLGSVHDKVHDLVSGSNTRNKHNCVVLIKDNLRFGKTRLSKKPGLSFDRKRNINMKQCSVSCAPHIHQPVHQSIEPCLQIYHSRSHSYQHHPWGSAVKSSKFGIFHKGAGEAQVMHTKNHSACSVGNRFPPI